MAIQRQFPLGARVCRKTNRKGVRGKSGRVGSVVGYSFSGRLVKVAFDGLKKVQYMPPAAIEVIA